MNTIERLITEKPLYLDNSQIAISTLNNKTFNILQTRNNFKEEFDLKECDMFIINIYTFNHAINFLHKVSNYIDIKTNKRNFLVFNSKGDKLETDITIHLLSADFKEEYKHKDLIYSHEKKYPLNKYSYMSVYIKEFVKTLDKRKDIEYLHILISKHGLLCLVCDDEMLVVAPRLNDNEMW